MTRLRSKNKLFVDKTITIAQRPSKDDKFAKKMSFVGFVDCFELREERANSFDLQFDWLIGCL